MARREFKGAPVATTITAGITSGSASFSINASTGWPTGAVGPFAAVLDIGTASEEKVLCSLLSAGVLTVTTRGYDGTTATAHNLGATISNIPTSVDFDEANAHINTTVHYTAPTIGSTPIPSGTTVTTVAGLTLTAPAILPSYNAQVGTTYTLVLSDNTALISCSNAGAITVSIPTNASVAFPLNSYIELWQEGVGQVTITAVTPGTTTILSTGATPASPKVSAQYAGCMLRKIGTDTWRIFGSLA